MGKPARGREPFYPDSTTGMATKKHKRHKIKGRKSGLVINNHFACRRENSRGESQSQTMVLRFLRLFAANERGV
jgi:hypothetical protein